jgi:hypothetical protein
MQGAAYFDAVGGSVLTELLGIDPLGSMYEWGLGHHLASTRGFRLSTAKAGGTTREEMPADLGRASPEPPPSRRLRDSETGQPYGAVSLVSRA